MEMRPTNLEVRGRHAHRWAAEKRGGRRGAQRRGRRSKTFKLSSPTLRSSEGWGRKAGLRTTLMRKVGGCQKTFKTQAQTYPPKRGSSKFLRITVQGLGQSWGAILQEMRDCNWPHKSRCFHDRFFA